MNEELVSIIVPVYNVKKYLNRCIKSIVNQSYANMEIILVDDGSSDGSEIICDDYKKLDQRILVIHQENGGLSAARNSGIKIASGKFITFIDSDDYISDDFVEYMLKLLIENSADISICQSIRFGEDQMVNRQKQKEEIIKMTGAGALENLLYRKYFITTAWGKMYKRSLFDTVDFPVGMLYEDYATVYKLLAQASNVVCSNLKKYYYLQRKNSIIHTVEFSNVLTVLQITKQIEKEVCKNNIELYKAVCNRKFISALQVLRYVPKTGAGEAAEKDIIADIKSTRKVVLFDNRSKPSTRILAMLSFINTSMLKYMGRIYKRIKG